MIKHECVVILLLTTENNHYKTIVFKYLNIKLYI